MVLVAHRSRTAGPLKELEAIAREAAKVFDAPMALISLIGKDRKWHKIPVGLDEEETVRVSGFCTDAIAGGGVSVGEDVRHDPRLGHYEAVTGTPNVRFFAGAPLRRGGHHRFGTVCVMDKWERRAPSYQMLRRLTDFANKIVDTLERAGDGLTPPS